MICIVGSFALILLAGFGLVVCAFGKDLSLESLLS